MTTMEMLIKLRELELVEATTADPPPTMPRSALRRDGVSQSERFPRELGSDHFRIDEREMEDWLELTLRLAGQIRFQDGPEGERLDWRVFFRKDLSVTLARVVRYDLAGWQSGAQAQLRRLGGLLRSLHQQSTTVFPSETKAALRSLITWVRTGSSSLPSPYFRIPRWQARISGSHAFARELEAASASVLHPMQQQLQDAETWVLGTYDSPSALANAADRATDLLARCIEALGSECARLQASARRHFEASLTDFPEHSPHAGLFIGFLQLLRVAQARLNELGPAQLDFYFKEVLRFKAAAAAADRVHLVGALSPGANKVLVQKGTSFLTADKRAFHTTQDWALNPATLSQTLGLRRGLGMQVLGAGGTEDQAWPGMAGIGVTGPAQLGWAVASRMLHLRGGQRTICLAMGWTGQVLPRSVPAHGLQSLLRDRIQAQVTTAKGWEAIRLAKAAFHYGVPTSAPEWLPGSIASREALLLEATVDSEFPAIVPYDSRLHGPGFDSQQPVIRFTWAMQENQLIGLASTLLNQLQVHDWHVSVLVGDRRPRVATEEGEQDSTKPFAPFGQQPALGNRWMIDVEEALVKNPDQIGLSWHWVKNAETDLGKYYEAYFKATIGSVPDNWTSAFWANLGFRRQRAEAVAVVPVYLFDEGDGTRRVIKFEHSIADGAFLLPPKVNQETPSTPSQIQEGHYLQIALGGPVFAFGHQHYTPLTTKAHLEQHHAQAQAIHSGSGDFPPLDLSKFPNPPLTPMIADVRLSYRAGAGTTTKADNGSVEVYHQGPFGVSRVTLGEESVPLLPQLPADAYLFLGLEGLQPPCMLSILVQVQSGTGDTDRALPEVAWRYLAGNTWQEFRGSELVADGTQGLRQSGIVQLSVPATADRAHTLLADGLTWLSMEVRGHAAALDRIAGIHLQALEVTLADVAAHAGNALSAGSITKSATYINGLKEVRQPYPGHGGSAPESTTGFQSRVSERLRHKGKSISLWDYERIVLNAFSEVDRVKCIPNTRPGNPAATVEIERLDHELSPGHVTVVCIPDTSALQLANPLQPRCRRELLSMVQDKLQAQVPPFVEVHVANPDYVAVSLSGQVVFMPGVDAGLGISWLEEAIAQFLCPWAFHPGAEIKFGGKVHVNQLLYLLEQQPYVDVVAGLQLSREGADAWADEVACSSSRQVLVAAQWQPQLKAVSVEDIAAAGSDTYGGIGWWRVNEDFFVNGN